MIGRAKVICNSTISSIYNTHMWRGSQTRGKRGVGLRQVGDQTGAKRGRKCGVGLGVELGGRTRGRIGGRRGSNEGGWIGRSDEGLDGAVRWGGIRLRVGLGVGRGGGGRTRWLVKFPQVSLRFADMSFDVDIVHPMCPRLGKVNFGLGKVTSWSVTVTAEVGRTP